MTTFSTAIKSKPFSRWLISITLLLSLLSFTAPAAISGNVISGTSTEQLFFRSGHANSGVHYLQHFSCQSSAESFREQKNTGSVNKHSLRNFKAFTTLRFNHLLKQYIFYKSTLQFSACRILLLPASEAHLS